MGPRQMDLRKLPPGYWAADRVAELTSNPLPRSQRFLLLLNVRDQRRRALGAPLADRILSAPILVPASGVPTRDDRCIA